MNVTVAEPRTPHNPHNNNIVSREPERQLGLRAFSLIDGRGEGDKPLPFFAVVRDTRVPGNATTYAVWMQIGERCQSEDHWWPLSLDEIADGARCSPPKRLHPYEASRRKWAFLKFAITTTGGRISTASTR